MSRGRGMVGALGLCVLILCALGAPSASATGLTAVKCVKAAGGEGKYNNSHCVTPQEPGAYETVALTETTEVEGKATTEKHEEGGASNPVVQLMMIVAGEEIRIACGKGTLAGKVTNVTVGEEMKAHGTEGVGKYSECHATLTPNTERKCSVQGTAPATEVGKIQTNKMTSTTGPEHVVTIKPEEGTVFMKFTILGGPSPCFTKSNLQVEVTGSVNAIASTETHSHLTFTLGTNGSGFKANGAAATYESTQVTWMKGNEEETVGLETF